MPWKPDYVDADELAAFVRVNTDNPYVATYGTAASRAIDQVCNRQFGQLDAAATFTYAGCDAVLVKGRWILPIDDLQDTTAMTVLVDGQAVTAGVDGYRLWPRNAAAQSGVYTALELASRPGDVDVDVFAKFGWSAIPAGVTGATWLQVNRWNVRRESPYGTAGSPENNTEVKLSAVLDPDVRTMLAGGLVRARMPR